MKQCSGSSIGESADWEFKSAKGGFPGSFWPTYSAMANTEGGTIVLGIREIDDHSFKFDGLTLKQINDYKKILWDNLNNRSKTSKNLLMEDDVQVIIVNDQTLLAIHIPRSSYTDGPIYAGPTPLGHTYRRCHEGDFVVLMKKCGECWQMQSQFLLIRRSFQILL